MPEPTLTEKEVTPEWLRLLELTTAYMMAAEAMIDGLQGKLGTKDRDEAQVRIKERITAYSQARRNLIEYAQEMEQVLTT